MSRFLLLCFFVFRLSPANGQQILWKLEQSAHIWPGFGDLANQNFTYSTLKNPLSIQPISNFSGNSLLGIEWMKPKWRLGLKMGLAYGSANRIIRDYFQPTEYSFEPLHRKNTNSMISYSGKFSGYSMKLEADWVIRKRFTLGFETGTDFCVFEAVSRRQKLEFYLEFNETMIVDFGPYPRTTQPFYFGGKSNYLMWGNASVQFGLFLDKNLTQRIFLGISGRRLFTGLNSSRDSNYGVLHVDYFTPSSSELIGNVSFREDFRSIGFTFGIEQSFTFKPRRKK